MLRREWYARVPPEGPETSVAAALIGAKTLSGPPWQSGTRTTEPRRRTTLPGSLASAIGAVQTRFGRAASGTQGGNLKSGPDATETPGSPSPASPRPGRTRGGPNLAPRRSDAAMSTSPLVESGRSGSTGYFQALARTQGRRRQRRAIAWASPRASPTRSLAAASAASSSPARLANLWRSSSRDPAPCGSPRSDEPTGHELAQTRVRTAHR